MTDPAGEGWLAITQVDAFTQRPFGGNPAAVVADGADSLEADQMQSVAREMNLSETAFLCRASSEKADVRIRWFTPRTEVDICGHATVAAFHVASEEGLWGFGEEGRREITLECRSGLLPIEVEKRDGSVRVRMTLPDPAERPWEGAHDAAREIGLDPGAVDGSLPALVSGCYALLPLTGMEALRSARPSMTAVARINRDLKGTDGLILASLETLEPASAAHVRMFAPLAGIDEDPVTGSAQGPVAAWLARAGCLEERPGREKRFSRTGPQTVAYTAEQGDILGRPGRVGVEAVLQGTGASARARQVRIVGSGVTVMRGKIRIP